MRTGWLLVLVLMPTACGGYSTPDTITTDAPATPDAGPTVFAFYVVASAASIDVYTNGGDLGGCRCGTEIYFPNPGGCAIQEDVETCFFPGSPAQLDSCTTCLTELGWDAGGQRQTVVPKSFALSAAHYALDTSAVPAGVDVTLLIAGCGHDEQRVPLGMIGSGPTASSATVVDDPTAGETVTWTSEPPAAAALLTQSFGIFEATCLADIGAQSDSPEPTGQVLHGQEQPVTVQTLAAPTSVDTALGTATVWLGGSAVTASETVP